MTETARETTPTAARAAETPRRADGLDALRGLAILAMVLSGMVPTGFPAWMIHAQTPPPTRAFNPNVPGITWVDLVFPFFLLAMGAAIPLALSRRLEKGMPAWRGAVTALQRLVLLGLFGVYVMHIRPFALSGDPGTEGWLRGLAAFAILFPILLRLPDAWPAAWRYGVRAAGWAGAAALMYTVRTADGARFHLENSDIILMILANVVVGTTLAWLLTRRSWTMRLALLGFLMAVRLAAPAGDNWVSALWSWQPPGLEWLWHTSYWGYLFVTVPGTMAGDLLARWLSPAAGEGDGPPAWTNGRMAALAALGMAATPLVLWGLFTRHVPATVALCAALGAGMAWQTARASSSTERLLAGLVRLGLACLLLGLVFEPYEGGIKKDPATMSYYFVCAGLGLLLLAAFTVVTDVFRGRRAMAVLAGNGQNPMIAYVGMPNLVQPLLFVTGVNGLVNGFTEGRPGAQFAHGAVATILLALAVYGFSRARLFWRT